MKNFSNTRITRTRLARTFGTQSRRLYSPLCAIAIAAVIVITMAACPSPASSGGGGGGGSGGGDLKVYFTALYDATPSTTVRIVHTGYSDALQTAKGDAAFKAIKASDITFTPSDVLTIDSAVFEEEYGMLKMDIKVSVTKLKAGTVTVTIKPVNGVSFTPNSEGSNVFTVP